MEPYEDTDVKKKCERIRQLIDKGEFVVGDQRRMTPILCNDKVGVQYDRIYSNKLGRHVTGSTSWGLFDKDYDYRDLWVLIEMRNDSEIPGAFLPQVKPVLGEAVIYPKHVIITAGNKSIEADIKVEDYYDGGKLRTINNSLSEHEIPVMVWRITQAELSEEEEQDEIEPIKIMTEHIAITASSVVVDDDKYEVVAAQIMPLDKQSLKALRATLAQSSRKNWVKVNYKNRYGGSTLRGSKKGFLTIGAGMLQENAVGAVVVILNPVTGDPQLWGDGYFYIVTTKDEDIVPKFIKRLDLSIPWPILDIWGEYLYARGTEEYLIENLLQYGDDFGKCVRVLKNENQWQGIIETGLSTGEIKIEESAVG